MFNKVKTVKPLDNLILLVTFENKDIKKYDVKPLFDMFPVFKSLNTIKGLFEQVKVDVGGYGVIWNDNIDLSCEELYENGKEILI